MELIQQELNQNHSIRENTYYTMMLIAFEKRKVSELSFSAIPKIDEILLMIKNTKLRQELDQNSQRNQPTTFDIDFFFLVAEQFRKYNVFTKRIFLTHLHMFLKNHQQAFMQIFDEAQAAENSFKKKLLSFFFMIIQDCVSSSDREISHFAENILIEVCFFQTMSSQSDSSMNQKNDFINQQVSSFISSDNRQDREKKVCRLEATDFDGHKLLTQIFMFFKNDNHQFYILLRLLHRLYKETTVWEEAKTDNEKFTLIRLNMKMLQLLQVIEQIFVSKPHVATIDLFIEAMVVLMYLLEKLRILDFALPDRVNDTFVERIGKPVQETPVA